MPNLASNLFSISGPPSDIENFMQANCEMSRDGEIFVRFDRALPLPSKIPKADRSAWQSENWGTSWWNDFEVLEKSAGRLALRFISAWSPPYGIYRLYAERYRTLRIDAACVETGNEFAWRFTATDGKCEETEPELTNEFYREVTGEDREEEEEEEVGLPTAQADPKLPPSFMSRALALLARIFK